jgi:hypothetical protein
MGTAPTLIAFVINAEAGGILHQYIFKVFIFFLSL